MLQCKAGCESTRACSYLEAYPATHHFGPEAPPLQVILKKLGDGFFLESLRLGGNINMERIWKTRESIPWKSKRPREELGLVKKEGNQ
ncbi:hypothetical protein SLA2020_129690 [Shorea laevis]